MSENVSPEDEYEAARRILGVNEASGVSKSELEAQLHIAALKYIETKIASFIEESQKELNKKSLHEEWQTDLNNIIHTPQKFFNVESESVDINGVDLHSDVISTITIDENIVGFKIKCSDETHNNLNELDFLVAYGEMPIVIVDFDGISEIDQQFGQDLHYGETLGYIYQRLDQNAGFRVATIPEMTALLQTLQSARLDLDSMRAMYGPGDNDRPPS